MPNVSQINADNTLYDVKDAFMRSITPETATTQNKLSTAGDVAGENISGSATGTAITLTDSADARVQGLTIYGRSEVVEGEIKSVGDAGWGIVDLGDLEWIYVPDFQMFKSNIQDCASFDDITGVGVSGICSDYAVNDTISWKDTPDKSLCLGIGYDWAFTRNIFIKDSSYTDAASFKTAMSGVLLYYPLADATGATPLLGITSKDGTGQGTAATITTALPLRSTLDGTTRDELIIGNGKAEVITRCEVVDDSIVPLTEPITTPLTDTEISAFRALRTFDSTTNINITDEPEYMLDYLKNTDNGEAVSRVVDNLQGQINTKYQLSEGEIIAQIADRIYQGTDLTVKFALEIATYNNDPWAWIKARITAGNFTGIHVGDYIPFTTTNNVALNAQIAGINTYKGYGSTAIGNHIDFICKELWATRHPVNKVSYNNGTKEQSNPWGASDLYSWLNSSLGDVPNEAMANPTTEEVDYTEDGVYYYLPTALKNVIVEKRFLIPDRYSASELLTDDNSSAWKNIGKLWLPDECEVCGMPVWSGKSGYSLSGSSLQYPLFAGNMNRLKYRNGKHNSWWLLSPYSGNSSDWCVVYPLGYCSYEDANNSDVAVPVCFRIA